MNRFKLIWIKAKRTRGKILSRSDGFGIVEVIVALVILSLCLLPLMEMAQSLQTQTQAVEDRQARAEKMQSALAYFRLVNVGAEPQGTRSFGDWAISWTATLADPSLQFTRVNDFTGTRVIGLYNVDLTFTYRLNGYERQTTHKTRSIGWLDEYPA